MRPAGAGMNSPNVQLIEYRMFVGSMKRQIFDMSVIRRFRRLSFTKTRNKMGAFLSRDTEYGKATGNILTADSRTNERSIGA